MIRPGPEKHGVWPNLSLDNALLILGYVGEPLGAKGTLICRNRICDALGLVVHDDGEQVVAVGEAVATRLVDEDAEFSHCSPG